MKILSKSNRHPVSVDVEGTILSENEKVEFKDFQMRTTKFFS